MPTGAAVVKSVRISIMHILLGEFLQCPCQFGTVWSSACTFFHRDIYIFFFRNKPIDSLKIGTDFFRSLGNWLGFVEWGRRVDVGKRGCFSIGFWANSGHDPMNLGDFGTEYHKENLTYWFDFYVEKRFIEHPYSFYSEKTYSKFRSWLCKSWVLLLSWIICS